MPPGDEYSTGGGGKLKLKGSKVSDGRVEKKKAKKAKKKEKEATGASSGGEVVPTEGTTPEDGGEKSREDEYGSETGTVGVGKTETERKYEEIRRKRMQERLRRDGFKTHKERVEELNKYLSGLTEHHDMPKIGPG
ncbi:uncharacterized protein ASPGLDRAFT_28530 [Aspergillus glaucus CBS 516.65]|uniref:DUF1754-domain-containing protein n=1 Tax=Aspergillus glaucus CBS 516.65 TaxID=1160497 RepID=A0A1L9VAN0_ASPGL|nr:hypothetical protein ASPGLDRAFT_28530 [Aspergillus glaucus CBS 516.65]OJJ80882.1 hypothetical protein ASPGLDRAFT_28530 [Aspergillus glaucus CBS 516.65]